MATTKTKPGTVSASTYERAVRVSAELSAQLIPSPGPIESEVIAECELIEAHLAELETWHRLSR